jgi:hypothetical protein
MLSKNKEELEQLKNEADKVFEQYLKLREKRLDIKKSIRADLGCECDGCFCHTEKLNEVIVAGEADEYCHDDQDRGFVVVRCDEGEILVIISAAVWSTFDDIDSKVLTTGQQWQRNIPGQSSWYDQTNRVRIIGRGVSGSSNRYYLDFKSWDD